MDKYVKFSVPIDKGNVKWGADYMRHGGSQLIEILEKEISYQELVASGDRRKFTQSQMERLITWIDHDCDTNKVAHHLDISESLAKSFFYRGAGMLAKLYQMINLKPVIEDNQFISRFSFINYKVIETDLGYVVISHIVQDKWSNGVPSDYERQFMTQTFVYDKKFERIGRDSELGRDMLDGVSVMDALTENI